MMPQSRKSLALALLVATPAYAQSVDVPAPVRPSAGQKAVMTWTGSGELTYECRAKADDAAAFIGRSSARWPRSPARGRVLRWAGIRRPDVGSLGWKQIHREAGSTAPASDGNIRFQLVKAEGGTGAMMGITYIQRLNTNGGAAPADACNASTTGAKNAVRYTAEYVFYEAG